MNTIYMCISYTYNIYDQIYRSGRYKRQHENIDIFFVTTDLPSRMFDQVLKLEI